MKFLSLSFVLVLFSCGNNSENSSENNFQQAESKNQQEKNMNPNLEPIENELVVFYNVENLFDIIDDTENDGDDEFTPDGPKEWTLERYNKKLVHIAEVLRMPAGKNPIFAGFCEIENRKVLEDLIQTEDLKSTSYKIVHFDSDDRRGIDVGFIYDSNRFEKTAEEKLIVKINGEPDFRTRDILHVTGKVSNGEELHVFVNHWSSRREGQKETEYRRVASAETLRKRVDELLAENPDVNILIMGDFNDTPTDKSIRETLRGRAMYELSKGDLVNFMLSEQKNEEGTIVHDGEWNLVDQLIVSQNLVKEQELYVVKNNAHILKNEKLFFTFRNGDQKPSATYGGNKYYGGYSDHLPVYLLLNTK